MKTECESLETSMEATSSDMTLTSVQESSLSDCGCLSANTLVSFHLRPRKGLDRLLFMIYFCWILKIDDFTL